MGRDKSVDKPLKKQKIRRGRRKEKKGDDGERRRRGKPCRRQEVLCRYCLLVLLFLVAFYMFGILYSARINGI